MRSTRTKRKNGSKAETPGQRLARHKREYQKQKQRWAFNRTERQRKKE